MIASFTRNFIYIRTRKTASTSTEIVLGSQCSGNDIVTPVGPEDEITRRQFGGAPRNFCTDPSLEKTYLSELRLGDEKSITKIYRTVKQHLRFHQHMSAAEVRATIPDDFWRQAFKFTVDRHPYEKVVSLAYWRGNKKNLADGSVLKTLIDELIDAGEYCNSRLYFIEGKLAVDRVLRYETLASDLSDVADKLGLTLPAEMPRSKGQHRKDRRPAGEILSESQKRKIRDVCAVEFEMHGYSV